MTTPLDDATFVEAVAKQVRLNVRPSTADARRLVALARKGFLTQTVCTKCGYVAAVRDVSETVATLRQRLADAEARRRKMGEALKLLVDCTHGDERTCGCRALAGAALARRTA